MYILGIVKKMIWRIKNVFLDVAKIMVNVQMVCVVVKKGYCGTTPAFCSSNLGCQTNYGKCVEGRCGAKWGSCQNGQCCSKKGYCGTTSAFCSSNLGCQSNYGKCITKCGKGIGQCSDGQCCSKKGYCGTTSAFCSLSYGCQKEYGNCEKVVTVVDKKVVTVTKTIKN